MGGSGGWLAGAGDQFLGLGAAGVIEVMVASNWTRAAAINGSL